MIDTIRRTNSNASWRSVFGQENDRMKDQELILRFFAMYESASEYKKPMSEFLNLYAMKNQSRPQAELDGLAKRFIDVVERFTNAVPEKLFRPLRGFNVAVFEACTVGLARAIDSGVSHDPKRLAELYNELFTRREFKDFIFASTSDVHVTSERLKISTEIFSKK